MRPHDRRSRQLLCIEVVHLDVYGDFLAAQDVL